MTSVLVLVDLQEDFLAEPGLEPHRDAVTAGAMGLLDAARRDGVRVVHVRTTVTRVPDTRMPHWRDAGRWACVAGTPGHKPPPALAERQGEPVVEKAGFGADRDAFRDAVGRADIAVVAGVHSHACIRQAALDLHQLGLAVVVARDAIGSHEPAHAARTEVYLRRRGIRFLSNQEIDAAFGGRPPAEERSPAGPFLMRPAPRAAPFAERIAILERAAQSIEASTDEIGATICEEVRKPIRHARAEAGRTAALFRAVAMRAGAERLAEREAEALVRRRPLGTIALITPWNNPVAIAAGQIAPAFAYGNAMVWKPSPAGARSAALLHRLLLEAGIPADALQLIDGGGDTALDLVASPAVDALCFTGSTSAGRVLAALAAERNVPVQAELGGNNGAIVAEGADLAHAARRISLAAFGCAGQRCTATRRAIVIDGLYDSFVGLLEAATEALAWGDPHDEATEIGPLVSDENGRRVAALVARATAQGHLIIQPQQGRADLSAAYHPPTIVLCDDPSAEIVQEESFGPVLVVQRARDGEEAMRLLNGVRQGLAAALFGEDSAMRDAFLERARAGILKLDQATVEAGVDVPFLGWGASGIGPPQHGAANREFFTRAQAVYGADLPSW